MIAEFEQRLADVLGTRLQAPFGGAVLVTPGSGALPQVVVGVRDVQLLDEQFGVRPEVVPGATDARRVLRLTCSVELDVKATPRADQRAGVDDLLYSLDAPEIRGGSALKTTPPGDPGFLIDSLLIVSGVVNESAAQVLLTARGWFWPAGTPGQSGTRIGEVRLRGVALPVELVPAAPAPVAGGAAVPLTVTIRASQLRIPVATELPFGRLAVRLLAAGNRPGAGTLSGGTAGSDGSTLVTLTDGVASFTYVPPPAPALDELVVALEDNQGGQGIELGRFPLRVRGA